MSDPFSPATQKLNADAAGRCFRRRNDGARMPAVPQRRRSSVTTVRISSSKGKWSRQRVPICSSSLASVFAFPWGCAGPSSVVRVCLCLYFLCHPCPILPVKEHQPLISADSSPIVAGRTSAATRLPGKHTFSRWLCAVDSRLLFD